MKKNVGILTGVVTTHFFLGVCIFLSRITMERHWCETLGGGWNPRHTRFWHTLTTSVDLCRLPVHTELALRYGMLIPSLGLIALLALAFCYRKTLDDKRLLMALLVVTLVSLILSAVYCLAIVMPSMTITYRMSK